MPKFLANELNQFDNQFAALSGFLQSGKRAKTLGERGKPVEKRWFFGKRGDE